MAEEHNLYTKGGLKNGWQRKDKGSSAIEKTRYKATTKKTRNTPNNWFKERIPIRPTTKETRKVIIKRLMVTVPFNAPEGRGWYKIA